MAVAPGVGGAASEVEGDDAEVTLPPFGVVDTASAANTTNTAEPTNTTTQIVRFEPYAPNGTNTTTPAELKTHANETQAPFYERAADDPNVTVRARYWIANAMKVEINESDADDAVTTETIVADDHVTGTHENMPVEANTTATTAFSGSAPSPASSAATPPLSSTTPSMTTGIPEVAWGVDRVNAPAVWETFDTRGVGATIAVLDTGVDDERADLTVAQWAEFNETGHRIDSTPNDPDGHGTGVASIATGTDASGTAVGVAPEATLYAAKVLDEEGSGTFQQIIAGLQWTVETGDVDIAQLSLGAPGTVEAFYEPVFNARSTGVLTVSSVGNGGERTSTSPANLYDSMSVGATADDGTVADFSSGETLSTTDDWSWAAEPPAHWPETYRVPVLAGPGVEVPAADAGDATSISDASGTSMAAPHVSGAAALVLSAVTDTDTDEYTIDELVEVLTETAVHPSGEPDIRYGAGVVDALAATEAATGETVTPANFTIEIVSADESVTVGETASVTASITNTGDETGSQEIAFEINDTVETRQTVPLEGSASTEIPFSYTTDSDDSPAVTATIRSANHSATTLIGVEEPDAPQVTIQDQEATGDSVVIADAFNPDEDFVVVIYKQGDEEVVGDIIGNSETFEAGEEVDGLTIDELDPALEDNQTVTAMLHFSTENDAFGAPIEFEDEVVADQAEVTIVEEPDLPEVDVNGDGNFASDTTGDGRLDDVNGNGESNILDVQALFQSRNDDVIQDNAELFDFNDSGDVDILDVQALFNQL